MKKLALVLIALFTGLSPTVAAQSTANANEPQRVIVEVQQTTKASQGKPSEYTEIGKAISDGLAGAAKGAVDVTFGKDVPVIEGIDRFSKTELGRFTMVLVGWKVAGKDAIGLFNRLAGIVVGIPVAIALSGVFFWFYRRNFLPHRVCIESTGHWFNPFSPRTKKWEVVNDEKSWSEGKSAGALITGFVWVILNVILFINVIF
jgi:hypothetical protein